MSVEALALDGADRDAMLTTLTSDRLASDDFAAYRSIASRNLFQTVGDSIGRQIRLSAITLNIRGQREAWFYNKRDDQTRRLKAGESLEVGALTARVIAINEKSAALIIDDQTWLVPIGASLAEARITQVDSLVGE
jgi:hypothetical protein